MYVCMYGDDAGMNARACTILVRRPLRMYDCHILLLFVGGTQASFEQEVFFWVE